MLITRFQIQINLNIICKTKFSPSGHEMQIVKIILFVCSLSSLYNVEFSKKISFVNRRGPQNVSLKFISYMSGRLSKSEIILQESDFCIIIQGG